ncbi:ImmA/IrrE family metallo-endopeptidase [Alloscardovia omnicolens]|jgi:hypothetical protein
MSTPNIQDLQNIAEQGNITILETALNGNHMGYYDATTRTIIVDSTLNPTQYRCTLAHELIHAKYDHTGHDPKNENKTRKETALWLINIIDYVQAEQIYDADKQHIARDLEITLQVLEDYQKLLREQLT